MALPDDPTAALDELVRRFGAHWLIRGSDLHRWWATTTDSVLPPDCRATVDADDLHQLEELLYEQERQRGRHPELTAGQGPAAE